ncbi:hypothetical protein GIB67_003090 [Kingdonia uniflora]|uniref:Uncharacterized protein n=1 Tax=Kingdonia uniflora TaxID=39325 RepID=A0A7J7N692_9MAGN|nr:hypothetical protein GIB67_003090 [Kingdonia uniflora]
MLRLKAVENEAPGNHAKLKHLWQLEGAKERLELVKAELMEEGKFDDTVMGCDGVFHMATPVIGVVGLTSDPKVRRRDLKSMGGWLTSIDDVALCHIRVYEDPNTHGRYLCSSVVLDNNDLVSMLAKRYPSLPIPERFELFVRPHYDLDTSKLHSLGFKFKGIEEMFDDWVASLREQGHLDSY